MGPVSIGVEVQRNTDGDYPSNACCADKSPHRHNRRADSQCQQVKSFLNKLKIVSAFLKLVT